MLLIDILKNAEALKKTLTRAQMSSLEKESATMRTAYEAQNKVAAKKAIPNQDWAALKVTFNPLNPIVIQNLFNYPKWKHMVLMKT